MSKPQRRSLVETLTGADPVTVSRDNVTTAASDEATELPRDNIVTHPANTAKRRSPNDKVRHTYHMTTYLPEEAQFALKEIALMKRQKKVHVLQLEAMADLFEKYNKGELAAEIRRRINVEQRDTGTQ